MAARAPSTETSLPFATFVTEALTGSMPSLRARADRSPWTGFIDSCLRGMGQGGLVDNPVGGLVFLAAIWAFSAWLGLAVTVAVVAATATAALFGLDREHLRCGRYGYNGALVGAGLGTFLAPEWNFAVLCYVAIGAVLSTLVMETLVRTLLSRWNVRPTALPFNLVLIFMLIALLHSAHGHVGPLVASQNTGTVDHVNTTLRALPDAAGTNSVGNVMEAVLHGIGQLFFLDNNLGGLLTLAGLVLCSRQIAILAVLGSTTAVLTSMAIGMDGFRIYLGVPGVSGFLTCAALGAVFLRPTVWSYLIGVLGAAASAIFLAGLTPIVTAWGPPAAFSLPYCFVTILTLFTYGASATRNDRRPLVTAAVAE